MTSVDLIRGETFHGRKGAVANAFRYTVDYLLLDPDQSTGPGLFSRNRANLTAIHDVDFGGPKGQGRGTAWVRQVLAEH
ncbi:MAG: cyclopropane-fatty-acyl-phospholipid synthase, partial [Rhodobacteraceae bacterium PARR1]